MGRPHRVLAGLVLVWATLTWTVSATAVSSVTVSFVVSDDRVVHGDAVTMSGTVRGRGVIGARVVVQRRADEGGRWQAFARSEVRSDRTWRLRSEPARGANEYRAKVVRRDGTGAVSVAVTVVAVWKPRVEVSLRRRLLANQWDFILAGEAPQAAGAYVHLFDDWSGQWQPLYAGEQIGPDGHFAIHFSHGGDSQVRACIGKDPDEGRRESCSAPMIPDASHVSRTLTLLSGSSGIRELNTDADPEPDRFEQYTEMRLETDAPAMTVVKFASRPPGSGDWTARGSVLTAEPGVLTYRLLPVPDGHEVRAKFMDGVIDAPATPPFVSRIPPIDVTLDQPLIVDGIGPDDGTRLRFDVAAGQVFHPLVYAGYPGMTVRVESPDGTELPQRTIDIGIGGPVVFYQPLTSGTHTAFITPVDTSPQPEDAVIQMRTPTVTSGPMTTDRVLEAREETTIEYHFQAEAGDVVTRSPDVPYYEGCGRLDLFEAGDYENPLPQVQRPDLSWPVTNFFQIPRTGEYVWRMTPYAFSFCQGGRRLWVVAPTRVTATPGRQSFPVTLPPGGWLGVTFEATQGDDIWVQTTADPNYDFLHDNDDPPIAMDPEFVMTPEGDVVRSAFVAETTGTYTFWGRPKGTESIPAGGADFGVIVELRRR